jgi:hypothetical protein
MEIFRLIILYCFLTSRIDLFEIELHHNAIKEDKADNHCYNSSYIPEPNNFIFKRIFLNQLIRDSARFCEKGEINQLCNEKIFCFVPSTLFSSANVQGFSIVL